MSGCDLGLAETLLASPKAVLVLRKHTGEEMWIPKSVIHDDSEVYDAGHEGQLIVAKWWAKANGHT